MSDQLPPKTSSAQRWAKWTVSLLNGAVGDYLAARQNGLAVDMELYHQGRPFAPTPAAILNVHPKPTSRLCVLVHGLGCHEAIWEFPAPDAPERVVSYGTLLQAELGYTPFFLRYNTGLAIHDNGRHLVGLLEDLVAAYPVPVDEIVLIGHSMGGLVIRYACDQATYGTSAWLPKVTRIFYLGSPHEGAPLARLGRTATTTLQAIPHPITRLIGEIFDQRSRGIKDLSSATAGDRSAGPDRPMPWLPTARHYVVAGAIGGETDHLLSLLVGDGLVPLPGRTLVPGAQESGAEHDMCGQPIVTCLPRMHHLQLAYSPDVYAQLKAHCGGANNGGTKWNEER